MPGLTSSIYWARQLVQQQLDEYPVASVWSPSGTYLAVATADGSIHLFSVACPEPVHCWQAHELPIQKLCWHPVEPLLSSGAQDGKVKYWLINDGNAPTLHFESGPLGAWVEAMAWRPDGQFLAVAAGKNSFVFDRAGKHLNTLEFGTSTIAAMAWSPRGTELALAGYQGIALFKGVAGKPICSRLPWQGSLISCCWSPDGKVIAACCQDNAVHFWRVKSRRDAQMSGFPAKPRAMAFTPDSLYLVTGGAETMTCWEFSANGPEGRAPLELHHHRAIVASLDIDAVSGQIAAGSKDGSISLWHSPTAGTPYYAFTMSAAVIAVHWRHMEGMRLLAALDERGHVGIWEIYAN